MRTLSTLTRAQGANRALFDGSVTPAGYALEFADEPVLVKGFRKMVRGLEFDVAEMALTTYLTAKEHGVAFTALPIFLVRDFHHGKTQVRADGSVKTAADLAGKRVGVNRGYTVTAGVWARAALAQAGLDLDSVTWVLSGDEHVASYVPPANVVPAPEGRPLEDLLLAGELDAVINAGIDRDDVVSLLPGRTASEALGATGVFPINHLVVVRDDLLAQEPGLARALFTAFAAAKDPYIDALRRGELETKQDRTLVEVMETTGGDPLPYGLEPNRTALETLLRHARSQLILTRDVRFEDVFAADTLDLVG